MKKIIFIFIMFFMICSDVKVYGIEPKVNREESREIEYLYDYMTNIKTEYEILNDIDIKTYIKQYMKNGDGKFSFKKISKILVNYGFKEVIACGKLMSMIIVICIICALITNLESAFSNGNLSNIAYYACYAMLIILLSKSFYMGISIGHRAIKDMTDFMGALIPVLLMLLASVGGVTQAITMDPIVIGVVNISARVFMDLIIPLITIGFVIQFANNITEGHKVNNLAKLINRTVLWLQGIIMTIFIGIITIRGMTAPTIDAVAEKTMKFAIDSFIPIVGKSLSDAISTVAGYSLVLKSALSSVGLLFLVVIIVFPIIKITVISFIYKLTSALIEPISDGRLVKCIGSAGDSLILITSCLISVSVMFFIMICIIANAGKTIIGG